MIMIVIMRLISVVVVVVVVARRHLECIEAPLCPDRLRLATEQAKLGATCSGGTLGQNAMQ